MELLGLIAVLFFLYLLIAPAVAWAKANAARAASEELKSALETRTRDLTDLRKQIVGLREQQLALLRRFDALGTIAPAAPTESVGPVPAPAARAATPTAAERSTRAAEQARARSAPSLALPRSARRARKRRPRRSGERPPVRRPHLPATLPRLRRPRARLRPGRPRSRPATKSPSFPSLTSVQSEYSRQFEQKVTKTTKAEQIVRRSTLQWGSPLR